MKALNLIVCLLAVTLFVACSKKKDGNSNPYAGQYGGYSQYNQGGYQQMPGYQLPQGSCQSSPQMFGGLQRYCYWLATEGERACNPVMVRQAFMQYCGGYAQQLNYCVVAQTGCYNTARGCSYQGKTYSYKSTYVSSGTYNDKGSKDYVETGKQDPVAPPVIVYPPKPSNPVKCEPNPSQDCYEVKPGKIETRKCRHPLETSDSKSKKTLSYSEYLRLVDETCDQTAIAQPAPVQSAPVAQLPVLTQPSQPVVSQPVQSAPVKEDVACLDLPQHPGTDCRLKRGERASAVRGIDKKALRAFDFEKQSDGRTNFAKENARGNIECKDTSATKSSKNYIYSSYEQYVASRKDCRSGTVTIGNPVAANPVVSAPISSGGAETSPIAQEETVKTEELAAEKTFLNKCFNLEELHNFILDPKNELSSYSAYNVNQPVSTKRSKEYLEAYRTNVNNTLVQSRMSIYGQSGQMSAIGFNVKQSGDKVQVDESRGQGEIIDCRNNNLMVVKYDLEQGSELVTYTTNNNRFGDELEITETVKGKFSFRNESGDYVVTRHMGVGKKMNAKQIMSKVTADMKSEGLLGKNPNQGNRYEVIKK